MAINMPNGWKRKKLCVHISYQFFVCNETCMAVTQEGAAWRECYIKPQHGAIQLMLTSSKKIFSFPLLQGMEFVVTISYTDWCIQLTKNTNNPVNTVKTLILLEKV